jgi:hypothetical protein
MPWPAWIAAAAVSLVLRMFVRNRIRHYEKKDQQMKERNASR